MKNKYDYLQQNSIIFLNYMKVKYPFYHNSNVFLRDMQYGIKNFFARKDIKLTYSEVDKLTDSYIHYLEDAKILIKLQNNTWKLNYPEFNGVINNNTDENTNKIS